MAGLATVTVELFDCIGIYYPRYSRKNRKPRVVVLKEECDCLVMDIFSMSVNEIPLQVTDELVTMHNEIMTLALDAGVCMTSAMHPLIASYYGYGSSGTKLKRRWNAFSVQLETSILTATSVTLLDLSRLMFPSTWLKRSMDFMEKYCIDYNVYTPEKLGVDMNRYPIISSGGALANGR